MLGCANELDDRRLNELRPLLPEPELVGLAVRLRAALGRIASEL
jgi:hypothetical protein